MDTFSQLTKTKKNPFSKPKILVNYKRKPTYYKSGHYCHTKTTLVLDVISLVIVI